MDVVGKTNLIELAPPEVASAVVRLVKPKLGLAKCWIISRRLNLRPKLKLKPKRMVKLRLNWRLQDENCSLLILRCGCECREVMKQHRGRSFRARSNQTRPDQSEPNWMKRNRSNQIELNRAKRNTNNHQDEALFCSEGVKVIRCRHRSRIRSRHPTRSRCCLNKIATCNKRFRIYLEATTSAEWFAPFQLVPLFGSSLCSAWV